LLDALVLGTIVTLVFSAGEEIGWRGYMLTRLIDGRIPYPILASGLIWGIWHTPLIMSGQYAAGSNPLLSVVVFLVTIASAGFLFAWARLATGSIWPAVVMHASWNATIQGAFDRSTTGENALLWTGESGILVAATLLVLAIVSTRVRYPMLRTVPPRQEPRTTEPGASSKAA
jgi:membrane protease YdiL (CAAX protease family)